MKRLFGLGSMALLATLTACGRTEEAASNIAAEEVNSATNLVAPPPVEPAANADVEQPAEEPQPTPRSSAPVAPAPKPEKPAPAKPKAPEPAPDPHAGHDMNNMQH